MALLVAQNVDSDLYGVTADSSQMLSFNNYTEEDTYNELNEISDQNLPKTEDERVSPTVSEQEVPLIMHALYVFRKRIV